MKRYLIRVVDEELDELIPALAALSIEGPKAVGKTETALRRARTVYRLDDPSERAIVEADPSRVGAGEPPILIDEWQRVPETWDVVRRLVDQDGRPGRFLLTGSASLRNPPTHSGAARIVTVRMRPLTLAEREVQDPKVSFKEFLSGNQPSLSGRTEFSLADYTMEIVSSGLPGLRGVSGRPLRAQLDSYVARIVDRDFLEMGHSVRRPQMLHRWMAAYAAATSTTATFETIRDAATGEEADKPARATTLPYRDVLERLWILDPVPPWLPTRSRFASLSKPVKHHLADPALAARLMGVGVESLLSGGEPAFRIPRDGHLLGHLFESLVTLSIRVFAQAAEASVFHLRTRSGRREIDLIVERDDRRVLPIEVKLGKTVSKEDVKHLLWLREKLGEDVLDLLVVHTGPEAYRRKDGVGVVPAALLGP
jgi:predicted AAA+ superfamily ATPase